MNLIAKTFNSMFEARSAGSAVSIMDGVFPFGRTKTLSGERVTSKSALKLSAFYNGVEIISNSVAVVPFGVYEKIDGGRQRLESHPVDVLLNSFPDGPDGYLTPFLFKKLTQVSVTMRGNALWHIIVKNTGEIRLKFINWDDVKDVREDSDGNLYFIVKGYDAPLMHSEVLHVKGLSLNGKVGVSVITYAATMLGIAMDVQTFAGTAVQNKGIRAGVIETDKALGTPQKQWADGGEAKKVIRDGWKAAMAEVGADRVAILDEGFKYKPITITPQEAQVIEMSRFTVEDICRWLNIAPHLLKSLTQSTNNNIEQQSLDFVMYTMQPHVTNIEQEFAKKLLTSSERPQRTVSGNINVLLRADIKARGEFYGKMLNGILTPNEIRALENYNAKEGGDDLRFQVNTASQSQIDEQDGNTTAA
jgi:HK97 family phage portal protein